MYYILNEEEYEKLYRAEVRKYVEESLADKIDKLVEWEHKENQLMVNYYAGCIDTLRAINDRMK